jgi:hypothetical protein
MYGRAYGDYPYLVPHITQSPEEIQLTPFTSSPTSEKPKKKRSGDHERCGILRTVRKPEMEEQGVKSTDRTHAG